MDVPCIPIAHISQYNWRWRFEARVTRKTLVRQFKLKCGEGNREVFSVDLVDRYGTQTRATFFGAAVTSFFDRLEEQRMYSFGGGRAKPADRRWCSFDVEFTFDERAKIIRMEDDAACPQSQLDFLTLPKIMETKVNSSVDVAAIAQEVGPSTDVQTRSGEATRRAIIMLLDDSNTLCRLTLWGQLAEQMCGDADMVKALKGRVLVVRDVRVSDFGGRCLSTTFSSTIFVDAAAERLAQPRVAQLASWFAARCPTVDRHEQAVASASTSVWGSARLPVAFSRDGRTMLAEIHAALGTRLAATAPSSLHSKAPFPSTDRCALAGSTAQAAGA